MTSTELAFRADIIKNPDDDAPRLIFADWLQEQGTEREVSLSRFIRWQIARVRGGEVPPQPPWFSTWLPEPFSKTLHWIGNNADRETFAMSSGKVNLLFTRGFISEIFCPIGVWRRYAKGIRAEHPATHVWKR